MKGLLDLVKKSATVSLASIFFTFFITFTLVGAILAARCASQLASYLLQTNVIEWLARGS